MPLHLKSPVTLPSSPQATPRFYWIWTTASGFPRGRLSSPEKENYCPKPIPEFEEALLSAGSRIWIADPFFEHRFGLSTIWNALCFTNAIDIRVISHERLQAEWLDQLKDTFGHSLKVPLQWRYGFQQLHDRFAVVDNDLWHFGSTVGGGYPGFGAASAGWSCDDMIRIFLSQWER